jgi:hypothetical protein
MLTSKLRGLILEFLGILGILKKYQEFEEFSGILRNFFRVFFS